MPRKPKLIPDPSLQPLRIPTGWTVGWNTFFDIDPKFRTYDQTSWHFTEDMLQIESRRLGVLVDLGWRPEFRARGSFRLVATRFFEDPEYGWTGDWDRPLRSLTTRSRRKVVATIENWLSWYSAHPPRPRRVKKQGGRLGP